jgi:hypothetical protein
VGDGDSVTVRRVRFLDANNQPVKRAYKKIDCFRNLKVVEDIRGKFKNDEDAYRWALDNLMPECTKKMAFVAKTGWWNIIGADLAIKDKTFIFYEKVDQPNIPIFKEVMQRLDHPAAIMGWDEPEWIYNYRVSEGGNFVLCTGAPNLSFWAHVPTDGPVQLPLRKQSAHGLENKYYVMFQYGDGDAPKVEAGLMPADGPSIRSEAGWLSADRGQVPIAWGFQPYLLEICPALLEYYAKTATPNDSFFAGPSGAGYATPSRMPDPAQFGRHTRKWMQAAGISMVDMWDALYGEQGRRMASLYNGPCEYPKVQCFSEAPPGVGWKAANLWLDDGTPIVIGDRTTLAKALWAPSQLDSKDPVGDMVDRIMKVGSENEPPFFITSLSHLSPSMIKKIQDRLPADKYELIDANEFQKLAREAGSFTATLETSDCRSGELGRETVDIEVVLRNPDGISGTAGKVTCTTSSGCKVSDTVWNHESIPIGGLIRKKFKIMPSPVQEHKQLQIFFSDSRFAWKRTVRVDVYPDVQTIGLPDSIWKAEFDVSSKLESGFVHLAAPTGDGR